MAGLDDFYFYLVLDNVKHILKIERQKRILEKLAIAQSLCQQQCFSILVINDALVQEIQVFKEHTNVFDEYMFSSFFFKPSPEAMLRRLMRTALVEEFVLGGQENAALTVLTRKFLNDEVFADYFNVIHTQLRLYTTSVNEYMYFVTCLWPEYMAPAVETYKAAGGVIDTATEQIVQFRGNKLCTKPWKGLRDEMLRNLYIHATSIREVAKDFEIKDDKNFEKRVNEHKGPQTSATAEMELFDHRQINYLASFKISANFSFMQSMALIAGYIAGLNKESMDCKIFGNDRSKARTQQATREVTQNQLKKQALLGKSKKFNIDRYVAILDFLLLVAAGDTQESRLWGHSIEYLATLNSLADEGLLKKSITKKSDSTLDDLSAVAFKCNFDQNFINEVAEKVNFPIEEYLVLDSKEE